MSLFATFIVIELGYRTYKSDFSVTNRVPGYSRTFNGNFPYVFDEKLGWDNRNNYSAHKNYWDKKVSIGGKNNRLSQLNLKESKIYVFGDSFSFGEGVVDSDAWPAQLSKLVGKEVMNLAVGGYGIDQIYLKTERAIKIYEPEVLIFSFIQDDIIRTKYKYLYAPKPYFSKANGSYKLNTEHIIDPNQRKSNDPFKIIFGRSLVVSSIMNTYFDKYWLSKYVIYNFRKSGEMVQPSDFADLGCWIMNKLSKLEVKKIILMPMTSAYPSEAEQAVRNTIVRCRAENIILFPLDEIMLKIRDSDVERYQTFFEGKIVGHPTKHGHKFVAEKFFERFPDL